MTPKDIIPLEELEEDLKEEHNENIKILDELKQLFNDAGFEEVSEMNNISFQDETDNIKAQFSIDNTTYKYTAYITKTDDNSFNYSLKGDKYQAVDAAMKFLGEYEDWNTPTEERELPTDDDDVEVPEE